jgi:fatty acid desaturase
MDDRRRPGNPRRAFWHARRRRRLLFMLGRYALAIAIILIVGWFTGGFWLRGFAIVASVLLALRLAFFFYNGRHLEERLAQRGQRPQRRRRFRT